MDHDDARFVVAALESRLGGDRQELERLAKSDVLRLAAAASRLKRLGADWPPAQLAAFELRQIALHGGKVADETFAANELQIFVDKLRALDLEPAVPAPRNRFERRRANAIQLPRHDRIAGRLH